CGSAKAVRIAQTPAIIDAYVAPVGPAQLLQFLRDGRYANLARRIVWGQGAQEKADAPHPLAWLRPRHNRPSRRAAEAANKFAPSHLQSSRLKIGVEN